MPEDRLNIDFRPEAWPVRTLGSLARYINGYAFKPEDWRTTGLPIIRIEQINNPDAHYDCYQGEVPSWCLIDNGDLLFSWSATLAILIWNRGPAILNQHIFKVLPESDVAKSFLRQLLEYLLVELTALSHGSTMKHIKRSDLLPLGVALPSLPEQCRIAAILDTADAAIQRTEVLIAKLQLTKAGLQYDLLTHGLTADGQLRNPVVHPEQFRDTVEGQVPQEWTVRKLGSLLRERPRNGYSPREAPEWTGVMMLGLGCLTGSGFEPDQLKNAPTDDPRLGVAMLNDGDLLLSRSNTRDLVALPGIYRHIGMPCTYPDLMMRLKACDEVRPNFLELLLRHFPVRRQLTNAAIGTSASMVKINAQTVMETIVVLPEVAEQDRILALLEHIDANIHDEQTLCHKLKLQKQGLIHDLLTGKVRVSAEDKVVI